MIDKKQSSIDWLISQLDKYYVLSFDDLKNNEAVQQAKSMHKEEIEQTYNQGYRDGEHDASNIPLSIGDISEYNNAIDYYNETYGKDEA